MVLDPVPEVVAAPGNWVIFQVPVKGSPLNTTLPVGTSSVGGVIFPTIGVDGMDGCAGMTTFAEGFDKHPSAVVSV